LAAVIPAALVLVLRYLQVRSSAHILFAGEFAGIARLFHWLNEGTFHWLGLPEFVRVTTYQWFAQGTSFLQVVALLLEPIFGLTLWGHWAAAALLEAAGVLLFAATITRISRPALGLLAGLAVALPPNGILSWNLMPYGNHNEFLWVPLGVAFWLAGRAPEDRRLREYVLPVLLLAVGCVLYRANLFPAVAAAAVLVWPRSLRALGRGASFGLAVGLLASGLFVYLGLTPIGTMHEGGLASFPAPSTSLSSAANGLRAAWSKELPVFTQLFDGRVHRLLLILGVLGAGLAGASGSTSLPDPRKRVALFAGLWGAMALGVPALTDHSIGRYFVPGWYAATLALACLLAATPILVRRGAIALFAASVLLGGAAAAPWVDRTTWSQTESIRPISLWTELEVNLLDLDEVPFYNRILDEGRASSWVGFSSHHPSHICPAHPGAGMADRPAPSSDGCSGWGAGGLVRVLDGIQSYLGTDIQGREQALQDIGRGAWIRSNRRLQAVEIALEGVPGELSGPVLAGARDEASRWAGLGGR
jgi:hypothetical protein